MPKEAMKVISKTKMMLCFYRVPGQRSTLSSWCSTTKVSSQDGFSF